MIHFGDQPPMPHPEGTFKWPVGIPYQVAAGLKVIDQGGGTFDGMELRLAGSVRACLDSLSGERGNFSTLEIADVTARSGTYSRMRGWQFSTEMIKGKTVPEEQS